MKDVDFSFFDYVPMGIIVLDQDFSIVHWNDYFGLWTQIPAENVLGKSLFEVYPNMKNAKYAERLQSVLDSGLHATFNHLLHKKMLPIRHKDGEWAIKNISASCLKSKLTDNKYLLITVQNITEIHRRNRQIKAIQQQILETTQKSNEALEEFASLISHDLKAPLRGISTYLTIFKDNVAKASDEESKALFKKTEGLIDSMNQMISSLLFYSKVGQVNYAKKECSTDEIVRSVAKLLQPLLNKNSVKLNIGENLPKIYCDQTRIRELFQNLIENAIKYNDKPEKEISVGYNQDGFFYVSDNGIGIEPQFKEGIFRMFCQIDNKQEGSGAGLALVKRIVERHDGEIKVESDYGKGTTFFFTLGQSKNSTEAA